MKTFSIPANRGTELIFALVFSILALNFLLSQPPDIFKFSILILFSLICLSIAWPFGVKEYRIHINHNGIEFSEWVVNKSSVIIGWSSIKEIRKQRVWSHPYGIGAKVRFKFILIEGKSIYLSKNFGKEFEQELIHYSRLHNIEVYS